MGKVICSVLENCLYKIEFDKNKKNKILKPNFEIINFIKKHTDIGYKFYVISNFCDNYYDNLDIVLNNDAITFEKIFFICNNSKFELILKEIIPDIYIDIHTELCAGLKNFGINSYLYTDNANILGNKCATGLKIL